jgi:UTP--glucose-1-phosphate uridylyltransferase
MKIKKAVIPVAGKGTRFLPATKEIPKEMIPIINKPMIHYAVMEAVNSGIEEIIFVTSSGKSTIEDYFDRNLELENFLHKNNKTEFAESIEKIGSMIDVCTIRQKEQLGLGHAVKCAQSLIGNEPFAVILGDDIVIGNKPVTKQLIKVSEENDGASVIGVMEVNPEDTNKYGIIDGQFLKGNKKTVHMSKMIEKPEPSVAPTNLATPGRYILGPEIFDCLEKIPRGVGGEYQLTDAINMLAANQKVLAHIFEGDRYDAGSVKGYLKATVEFALESSEYKEEMISILKDAREKYKLD